MNNFRKIKLNLHFLYKKLATNTRLFENFTNDQKQSFPTPYLVLAPILIA
jgi:hypothetical protein